jgi:hypothetical protein
MEEAKITRHHGGCFPSQTEAEAASVCRGKIQPEMVELLLQGNVMQTTMEMVAQDIAQRWKPKTQSDKARAAQQLQTFLRAVGMTERIFPASERIPEKTKKQSGVEEDALTAFALHRAMMGQGMKGVGTAVSHARTWHETLFKEELGTVGCKAKASPTSQYIKAMGVCYPVKDHTCKKRRPMTKELVGMVLKEARRQQKDDIGVVVLTAHAGLFRMGELTASEGAYNPAEDMAERDLQFLPNFWNANRVVINLGRSKADQTGARSKLRPRMLPVDDDWMSPGRALRDLLAERHGIREGRTPSLGASPPFQDSSGGQLKMSAVLTGMRRMMQKGGKMSDKDTMDFGTHSCRIGGATAPFQLGATPEVFKHLGGWSSDAHKIYVQVQQADLMGFARSTCGSSTSNAVGLRQCAI